MFFGEWIIFKEKNRASAACSHHLCGKTGQELLSKFSLAGKMDKAPGVMGIYLAHTRPMPHSFQEIRPYLEIIKGH